MNDLYGYAVSQYLPYANFKWFNNVKLIMYSSTGYMLEVDLQYPKELHLEHSYYPLAPEKINIQKEWSSDYCCLKIESEHDIKIGSIKKIVSNVMPKNNYVIHYRNLQQCLEKGLILRKVHRILKFKQKDWMKPYIDFNTQKRKEATKDADKNLFKLLNNAVYGKSMENFRKRIKIRIVKNEKDIVKQLSEPSYFSHKIFDKKLS